MKRKWRELVWRRAQFRCEYCQMPQQCDPLPFEIDHIIAEKHLGPTKPSNLALACFHCNNHKGPNIAGLDPASGELTRLFHPRNDVWEKHFQWAGALLTGTSAIGRATVRVLEINVRHRVIHRQALIEEGVFPARHLSSQQDHGYDYGAMMSSVRTASSRTLHSLMSMDSPEPCSRVPLPP